MVASLRVRRTAHQGTLRRLEEIPGFSPREVVMVLDVEDHVLGHAGQPVELSNNLRPYEQTQQTEDGDHRCWQCRPRRSGYGVGAASNKMLWKTDTRSPAQVHRNRISEKRRGKNSDARRSGDIRDSRISADATPETQQKGKSVSRPRLRCARKLQLTSIARIEKRTNDPIRSEALGRMTRRVPPHET